MVCGHQTDPCYSCNQMVHVWTANISVTHAIKRCVDSKDILLLNRMVCGHHAHADLCYSITCMVCGHHVYRDLCYLHARCTGASFRELVYIYME